MRRPGADHADDGPLDETGRVDDVRPVWREADLPDNKQKPGQRDRRRVACREGYEVDYFAKKHSITRKLARDLIAAFANDREKLNAETRKLKNR
jgi:hypothetical protein